MINVLAVPAFTDNYIWLICDEEKSNVPPGDGGASCRRAAIVDPGDAEPVIDTLAELSLTPTAILLTHHHSDHIGGVRTLAERYSLPVYGPARENITGITHPLRDGDHIILPGKSIKFSIMDVPGHTAGHIAYYGHGMLFCGDTLFGAGSGRLFEGTAAQMHQSLKKIAALPKNTLVYCAHEYTLANLRFAMRVEPDNPDIRARMLEAERCWAHGQPTVPSTLELELRTNPFLRCHVSEVIEAAENFSGKRLASEEEVFAMVRYWKDTLD